jgi:hypothetical protein
MSMMLPPDPAAAGGMPLPPGGGGPMPPMDAMSAPAALPAEGGIEGLMAALGGGGGGLGPEGPLPGEPPLGEEGMLPEEEMAPEDELDGPGHIQQAIKHLMLAMVANDDEEQSAGIVKGMGPLQALLGGEQKKSKILADAGG